MIDRQIYKLIYCCAIQNNGMACYAGVMVRRFKCYPGAYYAKYKCNKI